MTDIATGVSGPTPDAIQPSAGGSGVADPVSVASVPSPADQTPARDLTGERLSQLAAEESAISAAQHAGISAEHDRRAGYQAQALPLGGRIGDPVNLPEVPEQATGAAGGFLYPQPPDTPGYFGGDIPGR